MSISAIVVLGPPDSKVADHVMVRAATAGIQTVRSANERGTEEAVASADVVIDTWVVNGASKASILADVERAMKRDALLLVCCHATSATEVAETMQHPERVAGFGLLPPCEERSTVELTTALQADATALGKAVEVWDLLGHEALSVGDGAGLVVARVVACLANEAAFAVMEGVAAASDIDTAMRLGTGYPRGPLAWCDHVGSKDVITTLDALAAEHGDDRFRAAPLLRRMAAAGMRWEVDDDRT